MDYRYFLKDQSRIDPDDVLNYRREIFDDMVVTRVEAEGVFALNDAVEETCREWDQFFIEVMTDYCVNQANPAGYMSENKADWLIEQISADDHVQSDSELELLIRIIERSSSVPQSLAAFALRQVAYAVLEGNGKLVNDETLKPGVIGEPEARMIRRIMYGVGADGKIAISRAEVEVLFDLNDKTIEVENHPEWNDVFVKSVAAYLMMACTGKAMPREEVLRREAWLEDTDVDVAGMLSRTLTSFSDLMKGSVWKEAFQSDHDAMEEAWAERNDASQSEHCQAEAVDGDEARWLVDRIGRDGVMHENERALVEYLKEESPYVDPALESLFEKMG